MTTTSDGKKTFGQLSRRLGVCFLAAVLLGIMLPAEALACDIKEMELYVATTEAAAQTTTATSTTNVSRYSLVSSAMAVRRQRGLS